MTKLEVNNGRRRLVLGGQGKGWRWGEVVRREGGGKVVTAEMS